MPIEWIPITSEQQWLALRADDITASKMGAVFGLDPFTSRLEYWNHLRGVLPLAEPNEDIAARGRWFEPAVHRAISEKYPDWTFEKGTVYLRDAEAGIGATPDYFIATPERKRGILECKTVAPLAWERNWDDGVPLYVSLQLATCMMLDESDFGIVAALIIDPYKPRLIDFPLDERHAKTEERIRSGAAAFWRDVKAGTEPTPDFARDLDLIKRLVPRERAESVLDLRADNRLPTLCATVLDASQEISKQQKRKDEAEAEIRAMAGDNEITLAHDYVIKLRTVHRKAYSVAETSYRPLKIKPGNL